jgi:hypothetical protein
MKTAVEWLYEQILLTPLDIRSINKCLEQAKEMEKQQIIDAYWGGLNGYINDYSETKKVGNELIEIKFGGGAQQYYNQTFKSE